MEESDFFLPQVHLDTEQKEPDKEREDQLEDALSETTLRLFQSQLSRKDKNKFRDSLIQFHQEDLVQEGENASITTALIKKNIIRRTFKSKKNPEAALRHKAPKIQRLVTDVRLRRKRIQKDTKVKRWKKSLAATAEYSKLVDGIVAKRKSDARL